MKQVAYIASSDDKIIEVWNIENNGDLNLIQIIETDGLVQPMAIIKQKKLLYAGIRPNNRIITYSIQDTGFLKKNSESIIPGSPNYISFDTSQKFLFCSSYHHNCISVLLLNEYGIPSSPIQIINNIKGCHAAKINDKYQVLLVTALKEDSIYLYYLQDNGLLKSTEQKLVYAEKGSGPRHIAIHPNQNTIYTINELKNTINVWKLCYENNQIKMHNIQNLYCNYSHIIPSSYWAADIHITTCGRFLYTSDRVSHTIGLFYVDLNNNNTLSFIKSYFTEEQPRSFCIDQNNKYLLVVGQKTNTVAVYLISCNTGELKKLKTYNTKKNPLWIITHKINK